MPHTDATSYNELDLLKLHVEACWGLKLPALTLGDAHVLPGSETRDWTLYVALLAGGGEVRLWSGSPAAADEREALLQQALPALHPPPTAAPPPGVTCEVALTQTAPPALAGTGARRLTVADQALLEAFDPGQSPYYLDPHCAPVVGLVRENRLLSVAHSSRRTAAACELGVETRPEARRRGYALAVTLLWSAAVRDEGLLPLYSALADNAASLALAASSGYRPFTRSAYVTLSTPR